MYPTFDTPSAPKANARVTETPRTVSPKTITA